MLNLAEKADVVHRVWFISDDYAMVQSNLGGIQYDAPVSLPWPPFSLSQHPELGISRHLCHTRC